MLAGLVRKSLLIPEGKGRGMTYHLPWQDIAQTEPLEPMTPDLFEVALKPLSTESESLSTESDGLSTKSESLSTESDGLSTESENELNIQADSDYWQKLLLKATPYRQNKRVTSSEQINALKTIILQLCEERYLEGEKIAQLLDRNAKDLRHRYLNPLVEAGLLELRNANRSASNQAYKTRQI
jgi:ATP-dependent DNA helicase RecG